MSDFRPENNDDPFSLESILAEYKGTSYIDGDRRSAEDLLDARIEQIVAQSEEGTLGEDLLDEVPVKTPAEESAAEVAPAQAGPVPEAEKPREPEPEPEQVPEEAEPADEERTASAGDAEDLSEPWGSAFAEQRRTAEDEPEEQREDPAEDVFGAAFDRAAEDVPEESAPEAEERESAGSGLFSLFRRRKKRGAAPAEIAPGQEQADGSAPDGEAQPEEQPEAESVTEAPEEPEQFPETPVPEAPGADAPTDGEAPRRPDGQGEDTEILFFDDYRFAESDEGREFQTTWDETFYADGQEPGGETGAIDPMAGLKSVLGRLRRKRGAAENGEGGEEAPAEPEVREDVFVPEPDYVQTAEAWAKKRHSLMLRSRAALVLAFIMTVVTVLFERGVYLPGINASGYVLTAVLAFMQLVVMALAVDLLIRGAEDLVRVQPGYETLLLLSSLVVLFCCFGVLARHEASAGAPFCCVSAVAMALSLWGEYRQIAAMNLSLKTAAASETPEIFVSDYVPEIECNLIKHYPGSADGFYNNLIETDASESAYRTLTPILVCLVILFSLIGSVGSGTSFWRCLAAISAASASFSALSAFGLPFSLVARRLRRSGSAVAGWGGADTVYYADGVRVSEHDLFPAGATITGIKIFDQKQAEKVIRYTGSLLSAAQSGLAGPFSDFMDRQGISHMRIDSYEICEGGFSTLVRSENILCGTASCLNLYGVSIPTELNLKNAMYVALDGKLAGIFTVAYRPTKNVQSAMLAMLRGHLKLFVAGKDFNVSPAMVQQKLQIPVDDMEYLPFRQACAAAENEPEKVPHAAAVSVHSTPGTVAETVIGARRLRIVAGINTVVSAVTTILGMLIMLLFARLGAGGSVSPSSLCAYMLAMEVIIILVSHVA